MGSVCSVTEEWECVSVSVIGGCTTDDIDGILRVIGPFSYQNEFCALLFVRVMIPRYKIRRKCGMDFFCARLRFRGNWL